MRFLLFVLFFVFHSSPVFAQTAPKEEKGLFDKFNESFGKYVVAPLGSIMFFDLVFWDEKLPVGKVPNTIVTVPTQDENGKEKNLNLANLKL